MKNERADVAEEFVNLRMDNHFGTVSDLNALIMLVVNLISMPAEMLAALPENLPLLRLVHLVLITLCLIYVPLRRSPILVRCLYIRAVQAAYLGSLAYFVHRMIASTHWDLVALPTSNLVVLGLFLTMAIPGRPRAAVASTLLFLVITGLAVEGQFLVYYKVVVAAVVAFSAGLAFQIRLTFDTVLRSREEIRGRLHMAPFELVRRTITASEAQIDAVLKPRRQKCVCLTSDWRGYQALSRRITPEALAAALEGYYGMCQKLLEEVFPDGCYVSDWCADELVVIFLLADPVPVIAFAKRLMTAKDAFFRDREFQVAIDVGVAAGESIVGVAGPRTNRKMMAIGEVSVAARRYQALGKALRKDLGEEDRVIYASSAGYVLHSTATGAEGAAGRSESAA